MFISYCFRSTNSDESTLQNTRIKKISRGFLKICAMTFKTKQRAAVGVAGHRARSRVRCTLSEPWRKEKRDPRSVPAITPRCPDNRRKFNVDGRKSVVSQNIMITAAAVLMDPVFSLLPIPNTCILCKVESCCCCCCCFLTLTDPLRIQPWSQDRRNQTKSTGNRR